MSRNVVLLCLDTVRADHFREHATRIQERADLRYTQCRAASSWSVPSHASMFAGTLPHQHGVQTYERSFAGLDRADTFLGELEGYASVGASANVWASSSFGFDGLFDSLSNVSPDRRFPEGIDVARFGQDHADAGLLRKQAAFVRAALGHDRPLESLANGVLVQLDDWMARAPMPKLLDDGAGIIARECRRQVDSVAEPFFLFANFMDAHGPLHHVRGYDRGLHDAPLSWTSEDEDWAEIVAADDRELMDRYRGLYDAAIDYLDRVVVDLVEELQARTDRATTVVVTSDHGDNFAGGVDDGYWGHVESSLSEGLLHVPLVVLNAPGDREAVVDGYVSHTELGDLVVGLADGEVPDVTRERIAAERVGHSGPLSTVEQRRGTDEDRMRRCVYDGETKFCWDHEGGRQRYSLDPDRPCWQEEVDGDVPAEELEAEFFEVPVAEYKREAAGGDAELDVDEATLERMDDLGYV